MRAKDLQAKKLAGKWQGSTIGKLREFCRGSGGGTDCSWGFGGKVTPSAEWEPVCGGLDGEDGGSGITGPCCIALTTIVIALFGYLVSVCLSDSPQALCFLLLTSVSQHWLTAFHKKDAQYVFSA